MRLIALGLAFVSHYLCCKGFPSNLSRLSKSITRFSTLKPIACRMSKRSVSSTGPGNEHKRAKGNENVVSSACTVPFVPSGFQISRCRLLTQPLPKTHQPSGKCVVLWMSRDQRVHNNHAVHYAQLAAQSHGVPLRVVFNLVPTFLQATLRQYGFMIKGLKGVEQNFMNLGVPFHLLMGDPVTNIPQFVSDKEAVMLVTDFSPLRVGAGWVQSVANTLNSAPLEKRIAMVQVDAHNIVPCWVASPKLEYSARTFRGKITPKIPEYLTEIPLPIPNPEGFLDTPVIDWDAALAALEINREVQEVDWCVPGEAAAQQMLQTFINERLKDYGEKRNDPNNNFQSGLSPYIHFGQISVQSIVIKLKQVKKFPNSTDSFIEEAVVRRELTDNFCFYNPNYDNLEGCYDWAKETLRAHSSDPRPFLYNREQLEAAMTHDDLWNAAQIQLNKEGKMHGFLRMYWAKKILEWTANPDQALEIAIYLNDKYHIDGRDPNGYVGCMWSIGGVHDQGWGERAVFGKIRYMNYQGCERKFDVKKFVRRYSPAGQNAAAVTGQRTIRY